MSKAVNKGIPTIKELREYLGVNERGNDSILADFLNTSKEIVEKVLRYEIASLNPMPLVIKEAVKYGVAYLYTNRETADLLALEKSIAILLSGLRKEVF